MDRQPVDSTNVAAVGWAPLEEEGEGEDIGTLEVEFHSGHVYSYANVPERVYQELLGATSVGRTFNQTVKGQYDEQRIA